MGFFKRKKDKKKDKDEKEKESTNKKSVSVGTIDVIEEATTEQERKDKYHRETSKQPHFPSDSIPVPPPVMNDKDKSESSRVAPPKLPDVGSPTQMPDEVRKEFLKDSALHQEQSVLEELRGVLSVGGGLHETPEHKKGRKLEQSEIYLSFAKEYEEAAKKHEEAELWQPAAMNYLLSVLSVYLATNATEAAKRLTALVKSNPFLITSKPVQQGRTFFEALLQEEPKKLDRTMKEMRELPFQYRDDTNLFKKAIRKAKDESNSF